MNSANQRCVTSIDGEQGDVLERATHLAPPKYQCIFLVNSIALQNDVVIRRLLASIK
jgi:hypothetical protein